MFLFISYWFFLFKNFTICMLFFLFFHQFKLFARTWTPRKRKFKYFHFNKFFESYHGREITKDINLLTCSVSHVVFGQTGNFAKCWMLKREEITFLMILIYGSFSVQRAMRKMQLTSLIIFTLWSSQTYLPTPHSGKNI